MSQETDSQRAIDAPSLPEADPWIGRVIDERYRVEEFLGEGGMGSVFVAEHLKLHKQVALKIIHPEFAGDGEVAARFAREAMASAQLDHPHVASALDYGTLPEGGAYLVMQLVHGQSLQERIDDGGRMSWPEACAIAAQIADALTAAHAKGIVHRDLKPDNALLQQRDDGSVLVKVLDFGIARVKVDEQRAPEGAEPGKALTRVGTVMGTPGYMAPEQAMGESVDARADLYSLGVVLWEMVVGRAMFDTHDLTAIVTQQLTQEAPALRAAAEDRSIPEQLEILTARLLARAPADRPDKASEVRDELRKLIYGSSSVSLPSIPHAPVTGNAGTANTMLADATGPQPTSPGVTRTPTAPHTLADAREALEKKPVVALAGCGALVLFALLAIGIAVSASGGDDETKADGESGEEEDGFSIGGLVSPMQEQIVGKPIEPEVQERIDVLLGDDARDRERTRAARWLKNHEPATDVPEWAALVADLELARNCNGRKAVVLQIREAGAEEALPALERLDDTPKDTCRRFFRAYDCHRCMRGVLAVTVDELGGDPDYPEDAEEAEID